MTTVKERDSDGVLVADPKLYECHACKRHVGIDATVRHVRIGLSSPWPYGEALCAMQIQPLPAEEVWGLLCVRCSRSIARIFDGMKSNVLAAAGHSS